MIRRLNLNREAAQIMELQKNSYLIEAKLMDFYDITPLKENIEDIKCSEENFFGYFIEDELSGMVSYTIDGEVLDICRVAVSPKHFRKGIAEELIKFVEKNNIVNKLIVSTGTKNIPAVKLYKKLGFYETGKREVADGVFITLFEKTSIVQTEVLLKEAQQLNPGPWVQHSIYVGQAARLIAENCSDLNAEAAYILGILHDIGRRAGVTNMRHTIDGYNYLMEKGWHKAAQICMTHSFNVKDIKCAFGKWDCTKEEYDFVVAYLDKVNYDDYDRLIQLCDALALPEGFCLLEKRMIDVAVRHGVHEHIIPKWKSTFEIKEYFERKMGKSIYSVLPGVIENTFNL